MEELNEGREDTLDTRIKESYDKAMLLVFPSPTFPTTCNFLSRSNFPDSMNFQCEETAIKLPKNFGSFLSSFLF